MVAILPGLAAFAIFVGTTLNTGVAAVGAIKAWRESALFPALAVAAGMTISALAGFALFLLPTRDAVSGWAVVAGLNVAALVAHFFLKTPVLSLVVRHWAPVAVWGAFSISVLALSLVPPREPVWLEDGPYPFKEWTLPVKVQALTGGMPADNALPAYVGEMMARDMSFKDVRPVCRVRSWPTVLSYCL